MPRQTNIKPRRGTAAQWSSANPVLDAGEIGVETDTGVVKIGNGSTAWTALNPILSETFTPQSETRKSFTSSYSFTPGQSTRLAGSANATYSMLGIDEVASAIFVRNSTNTRIMQSDDLGSVWSGPARTLPSDVTYDNVYRIVRYGAYIYMLARATSDSLLKVYRATPVTRTDDWTDWSGPLLTLTSGSTGFGFSMEKSTWSSGTNYLYVSEYGDPSGGPKAYRSADGTSWTTILAADPTLRHYHHILPDPYNPGHVWATAGDGTAKTIMRSINSGDTWTTAIASSAWQAVQISFTPSWVYLACDSRQGTMVVVDRDTNTPYLGTSNYHHFTPPPETASPARTVVDGSVTSGSATLTSSTAAFTSADIGKYVVSANAILPHTYIQAVGSSTSVTLSANASVTSSGRTVTIGGDMYYANAYCGTVDPATGIYYAAAMDTSQPGTTMGLFVVPQVGARAEILDPGGTNISMNSPIYLLGGYLFCGQWKRALLSITERPRY